MQENNNEIKVVLSPKEQKEKDNILAMLAKEREDLKSKIKDVPQDQIFAYYWALKLEYTSNKAEYNKKGHMLSKKERNTQYMTLIYKQGCLKALVFALGIEEENSNTSQQKEEDNKDG